MEVCEPARLGLLVVLYNPADEFFNNFELNLSQFDHAVVVDNSTDLTVVAKIKGFLCSFNSVDYVSLGCNKGIAFAQNVGSNCLIKCGVDFMLELDQDTLLSHGYVAQLYSSYENIRKTDDNIIGVVGTKHEKRSEISVVSRCQSSGLLINLAKYLLVGERDSSLFIDYVDWSWQASARSSGFTIYQVHEATMSHQSGISGFGRGMFRVNICSPIRHYYQVRNIFLLRSNNDIPRVWLIELFCKAVFRFVTIPIYGQVKVRYKYFLKGLIDGIAMKGGCID